MNIEINTRDSPPLDLRRAQERPEVVDSRAAALWFGILGPPLLLLLNLEISYAAAPLACRTGGHLLMHVPSAILFAAVVVAGLGAARHLPRDRREDTVVERPAFMAMVGVLLGMLGIAVIVAQWLPNLFLSPCQ
jgi:hypothetical protein